MTSLPLGLSYAICWKRIRVWAQIAEAGNVTEAVESILSNKPDVLFLDITMPGRSGIELAETLQNLKTPPVVVFVTAFAEFAADAYNLDAVDYVVKPVEDARLSKALDKIEAALGARRVIHAPAPAFASDGGPRGQKGVHSRRRRLLL